MFKKYIIPSYTVIYRYAERYGIFKFEEINFRHAPQTKLNMAEYEQVQRSSLKFKGVSDGGIKK